MRLFQRFEDTIFYKKDSELEKQIQALKTIHSQFPENRDILQQLKLCELGLYGEKEIEYELKNANLGLYVLHDVKMKYEDLSAQIDYIVISKGYIYFIECKNLIGNITVNNRGEFIRNYSLNGKEIKEGFYSPIRQSERHFEIFKKIWNQRNNSIYDQLIRKKGMDIWYKQLVVMANSKNILNTKYAPKNIKDKIIKSDCLVNYIKKDINRLDSELLSNQKNMENIARSIVENYNVNENKDYISEFTVKYKLNNNKQRK